MQNRVVYMLLGPALLLTMGCPKDKSEFEKSDASGMFPLGTAPLDGAAPHAAASAAPLLDVCALLPVATVALTTGVTVTATEIPSGVVTPECIYKPASGRVPRLVVEKSLSTIAGAKQLWPGGKDLPGLGDAAYLAPKATELDVQKGSTVIRLGYEPLNTKASEDERAAVLRKLADLAVPVLVK